MDLAKFIFLFFVLFPFTASASDGNMVQHRSTTFRLEDQAGITKSLISKYTSDPISSTQANRIRNRNIRKSVFKIVYNVENPQAVFGRNLAAGTPASAPSLARSHIPHLKIPHRSPPPPPNLAPEQSASNSPGHVFRPEFDGSNPTSGPAFSTIIQTETGNDNIKTIVIAVVITAIGSFSLAGLCFCCYTKWQRIDDDSEKGGIPLLALSQSDFSQSSSTRSWCNGHSSSKEDINTLPINIDASKGELKEFVSPLDASQEMNTSEGPHSGSSTTLDSEGNSNTKQPPSPPPPPPPPPPPLKVPSQPPPAPPLGTKKGPPAPPPPKAPYRPPPPAFLPPGKRKPTQNNAQGQGSDADGSKVKLKPFFWDKMLANPDQSMVWHHIRSGSFQYSEEMIEILFGYNPLDKKRLNSLKESSSSVDSIHRIQIIDAKKSQNIAILLKALNVKIEEVKDALTEGNELPNEFLQVLLKMAPIEEEERKLRSYDGDVTLLETADQFLKALLEVPLAYKRLETLLFMGTLREDIKSLDESLVVLEIACKELKSSRLFFKLLEAVLKTGNRMNNGTYRGGAEAFKLDTLLKLSDVKGVDGKTTLLHFVVQEIIRSEGVRAAHLPSSSISSLTSDDLTDEPPQESEPDYRALGFKAISELEFELENVKKAANIDIDMLVSLVQTVKRQLAKTKGFLENDLKMENDGPKSGFYQCVECFVEHADTAVARVVEEEKRVKGLVKKTIEYFNGKDEGLDIFGIVRSFLVALGKACKEVQLLAPKVEPILKKESGVKKGDIDPRKKLMEEMKEKMRRQNEVIFVD